LGARVAVFRGHLRERGGNIEIGNGGGGGAERRRVVHVSGTTATRRNGRVAGGHDPAAQATFALDIVEASLKALGASMAERNANIEKHGARWRDTLTRCHKMLVDLEQLNVFCDPDGNTTIQEAHRKTELPFILGRLSQRFPRIEEFRSQKVAIAGRLKADIFSKSIQDLSVQMGGTGRNGTFQKKLLKFVDDMMCELAGLVHPRLFTKKQKKEKLKQQGGLCTVCNEKILPHHLFDGDHVVEWSKGGATTLENLQILHHACHQAITSKKGDT